MESMGRTIEFNPDANRLWVDGDEVVLTALELKLLQLLWLNQGKLLLYSTIIDAMWEDDAERTWLKEVVTRLRKKIGEDLIQNRRGIGYGILKK